MRSQLPRAVIDTNVLFTGLTQRGGAFQWRPGSPDPGDDMVIDCAMNVDATVITSNVRDYRRAVAELGLSVMQPVAFANALASTFPGKEFI